MDIDASQLSSDNRHIEPRDCEVDNTLICIDTHQETNDVKTFTFSSPAEKRFSFRAGQYFRFDFDLGDEVESRCYSISSSPQKSCTLSITVKRVIGGKISNWLHDSLEVGAKIKANGPLGNFVRTPASGTKFLLISGGSGFTPAMSMVREMADTCEPTDVVFMHAARTPKDLIFRAELSYLATKVKGLRLHFLPEVITGELSWPGLAGRISKEYIKLAAPDISERTMMCCGPAPFMAAARKIVADLELPPANYIEESFNDSIITDLEISATLMNAAQSFQVEFAKQSRKIEVCGAQTILSSAKKAGLRIPSSCCNGLCGTCKSKLISGSVDMNHSGGIRQREIDAGFFLPCCSKPLSDLVIDR